MVIFVRRESEVKSRLNYFSCAILSHVFFFSRVVGGRLK